ncbi:type II secretion system protein GspC [Desulfobacterales bacterium HSG16]|nr:type II secretion system protein GspC [Desulfobacterales bacterium HSG16]
MKKYFIIANLVLVTGMIYTGVNASYKTLINKIDVNTVPVIEAIDVKSEKSKPVKSVTRPMRYYKAVGDRNLFNTPDPTKVTKEPEIDPKKDLKPTKLRLKLWGTIIGDKKIAYAIIEDQKKRKQQLHVEGDVIQKATIKKIFKDKVILSLAGNNEVLKMVEIGSRSSARSNLSNRSKASKKRTSSAKKSKNVSLARTEVENAITNVNDLMRQAKIRPHFQNGKADGLTITRIKPNSIFSKLGLRSGDVIKGVDGNDISSVDDALQFYNSLKSASNVSLEIRRRGRSQTIEYAIDE